MQPGSQRLTTDSARFFEELTAMYPLCTLWDTTNHENGCESRDPLTSEGVFKSKICGAVRQFLSRITQSEGFRSFLVGLQK